MIIGIGSDLIDIRRIAKVIERHGDRFLDRIFTEAERARAAISSGSATGRTGSVPGSVARRAGQSSSSAISVAAGGYPAPPRSVRRQVDRQRLGHRVQPGLGRAVGRGVRLTAARRRFRRCDRAPPGLPTPHQAVSDAPGHVGGPAGWCR
jgi:hypothetical protein